VSKKKIMILVVSFVFGVLVIGFLSWYGVRLRKAFNVFRFLIATIEIN